MKHSLFNLLIGSLFLTACSSTNQPIPTLKESGKLSSQPQCYLHQIGDTNTVIQLQENNNSVEGYFAWEPYEKDSGHGMIVGRHSGDEINADLTYIIEGSIQTEEVAFKFINGYLVQGEGQLTDALKIADRNTLKWTKQFKSVNCNDVGDSVARAIDAANDIQKNAAQVE